MGNLRNGTRGRPASFASLVWVGFRDSHGFSISLVGVIGTVITAAAGTAALSIPLWVLLLSVSVATLLFAAMATMIHLAWSAQQSALPKVVRVVQSTPPYEESCAVLIVAESPLLATDMPVSVYQVTQSVEYLVGMGRVVHQQQTGEFQIAVAVPVGDQAKWKGYIANGQGDTLLVKPSIPSFYLPSAPQDAASVPKEAS